MKYFVISLLLLTSCISCCNLKNKDSVPQESKVKPVDENSKLEGFIAENTFKILKKYTEVSVFIIEKKLLQGTTDEYSNKSTFLKKLNQNLADDLVSELLKDSSYDWKNYKEVLPFEPAMQFVIKSANSQVNVMYDPKNKTIRFFTLEGPSTVPVSNELYQKLQAIL